MDNYISVTDVVENTFCEHFTYFSLVMNLKQYEEKRGVVISGKSFHTMHEKQNKEYVPLKIEGKKIIGIKLFSKKLFLSGKIDEAIETNDEIILIERKYTDYTEIVNTIKVQVGLLAILLEENFNKSVKKAIIIFSKQKTIKKMIIIDENIRKMALSRLDRTKKILSMDLTPYQKFGAKCINCCYKRICPIGSLNTTL